jgi:hypothetical protein
VDGFLYFTLRLVFFVRTVWSGRLFCPLVQLGKIAQAGFLIFLMGPLSGLHLVSLLVRLFGGGGVDGLFAIVSSKHQKAVVFLSIDAMWLLHAWFFAAIIVLFLIASNFLRLFFSDGRRVERHNL